MKSVRPPVFYEKNHKTALILRTMASLILSSYRIDIPGSRSIIPTKRGGFQTVSLAVGINIVFIKLEAIQQFGDQSYIQVPGKDRNTALLLPWGQFQKSPTLTVHPRHPADNPDLDSRRRDPTLPWRPPPTFPSPCRVFTTGGVVPANRQLWDKEFTAPPSLPKLC